MTMRVRCALVGIVLLATLVCCVSPQTGQQPEPLDRWLSGPPQEAGPAEQREPPRRVTLESLAAERTPLAPPSPLPSPEYFSFCLPKAAYVSVTVSSPTGAAIALVDRSQGVLSKSGAIGQRDGRIDALLDSGEYRVRVDTARSSEEAKVEVSEFAEVEADAALLMSSAPGTLHARTLRDREQRSYWIQVASGDLLVVEAMGRALRDVRIWKDGLWVIATQPAVTEYAPVSGRTMGYVQTSYRVEAGAYLVTFYGGPVRAWEKETGENPFYLRCGARYLGSIVDANALISPMGRDAYLVSGDATVMEVENPDFVPVRLGIASYGQNADRFRAAGSASIERAATSTRARATVSRAGADTRRWLFVAGTPGDTVRIRAIPARAEYLIESPLPGSRYLISTISTLDSDHALDATPVISRRDEQTGKEILIRSEALSVTDTAPLVREVNLGADATFAVELSRAGRWAFRHDWPENAVGIAIVPLREAGGYPSATQAKNPASFDLEPGKHVVMLWPRRRGVFRFVLYYQGPVAAVADSRAEALLRTQAPLPRQDVTYVTDEDEILPGRRHTVNTNDRAGPSSALFVERLPLTLRDPVPLTLGPGQALSLPIAPTITGALSTGIDTIEVRRDGQILRDDQTLHPGEATLELTNTGTSTTTFVLEVVPAFSPSFTTPPIPELEAILPVLRPGPAVFHDFRRGQTRQFLLLVQEPGFYELQTTGRLAMSISTRTPVRPRGASGTTNGPGRNALIQAFFRPGAYLVDVAATGNSEGRAGLLMAPLRLDALEKLREGVWYRSELEAGVGLVSTVEVESEGQYDFRSVGLYGAPTTRIEDADAWPLDTARLRPGLYRYYSWPQTVWNRRLTAYFRREEAPTPAEGEVWPIVLNRSYHRVWNETPNRTPHSFRIESPAPLPVSLGLSERMEWWIVGADEKRVAEGAGSLDFVLPAGRHTVAVRSLEENNNVDYDLSLTTPALASGIDQVVDGAPYRVPLFAGTSGTYEIWSTGTWDVRATLRTADGDRVLAQGDDRPGDWNFHLSRYLPAGEYLLDVDSVFSESGDATVSCRLRDEVWVDTQTLPVATRLSLAGSIVGIPFRTASGDSLVRIAVDLPAVQLSLYREEILIAEGREALVVPLPGDREYVLRMRYDSFDTAIVGVEVRAAPTQRVEWSGTDAVDLPSGAVLVGNSSGVSALAPGRPGRLLVSSALERMAREPEAGIVACPGGAFWAWSDPAGAPVRIQPLTMEAKSTLVAALTDDDLSLRIATPSDKVYVLEALSATGILGMSAGPFPAGSPTRDWAGADMESSSSILGMAGDGALQVWLWDGGPREVGRRVEVSLWESEPSAGVALRGSGSLLILPGQAVSMDTREAGGVRVLLSPGLVAIVASGGRTIRTVAARDANLSVLLPGGGTLYLANTGSRERLARVEPDLAVAPLVVTQASGLETRLEVPSTVSAHVEPAANQRANLAVWAVEPSQVLILTEGGRRVSARPPDSERPYWLLPNVAGEVRVSAQAGPMLVLPLGDIPDLTAWAERGSGQLLILEPGPNLLAAEPQRWKITLDRRAFVVLASQSRGVTILAPAADVAPKTAIGAGEARGVFAMLDPGSHAVLTRPLAGELQPDPLWLRVLDPLPVSEATETAAMFLDAGEQLVFEVQVRERAPVGIGVAAEADDFTTYLFDDGLHMLGSGRIHYEELEAGRYYLLVENGRLPMKIEPVVLSDQGSRTGVPEDVIQSYRGQ